MQGPSPRFPDREKVVYDEPVHWLRHAALPCRRSEAFCFEAGTSRERYAHAWPEKRREGRRPGPRCKKTPAPAGICPWRSRGRTPGRPWRAAMQWHWGCNGHVRHCPASGIRHAYPWLPCAWYPRPLHRSWRRPLAARMRCPQSSDARTAGFPPEARPLSALFPVFVSANLSFS